MRAGDRQEGPFEVGPGDLGPRARPGRRAARATPAREASRVSSGAVKTVGTPRGHPLGEEGAVEPVPVRPGRGGHVDAADPVHLEVHEAGDQHHVGAGARGRTHGGDQPSLHHDLGAGHRPGRGDDRGRPHDGAAGPEGEGTGRGEGTGVVRYRLDVADPRVQVPPNCDLTLGMVCVDKTVPGTTVWQMPADERFTNPVGVLQGGFLAACCDSAMGAATVTWAKGRKVFSANAEMKVSFLAPVRPGGTLTCTSRVVSGGGRVAFVEAEVTDDEGRLVAKASSTYLLTPRVT